MAGRERSRLQPGAVPARGEIAADFSRANASGFERLVAQGKGGRVLGVVDGETNKVAAPVTPKGTTRLIHNHPRFTDVARGGGFSAEDLAYAVDRYKGNFHVLSDEGSTYSMKAGAKAPQTSFGIDRLAARHESMRADMVGKLKAQGVSAYDARIVARSAAAKVLKGEGVILYREALRGSEKAAVANNAAAMQKLIAEHMRAPGGGGMAQSVMKASAVATPIAAASVAALAYRRARDEGKGEARASLEAAGAGASTAVAPAVIGAAAAKLAKSSSIGAKALGFASRALLPVSVVGHAGAYALAAIQRGEGVADVAKAAGWGAVNGVIPVDLAMDAYHAVRGSPTAAPAASPQANPVTRSETNTRVPGERVAGERSADFAAADAAFRAKWGKKESAETGKDKTGSGETRKGWANPSTQHAAQSARGVQQFSDWAEPGSGKE